MQLTYSFILFHQRTLDTFHWHSGESRGVSSVSAETPFGTPSSDRLLGNCHSYTRLATEWLHETVTTSEFSSR